MISSHGPRPAPSYAWGTSAANTVVAPARSGRAVSPTISSIRPRTTVNVSVTPTGCAWLS